MEKYRKYAIVFSVIGLVLLLTGVTYSFFNYTKTGLANNFNVGDIYFNTSQNGNINLTNVFPITSSELSTDVGNHDSVTISITGNTDYARGVEYLVSFVDVNNTVNNKKVPIVFTAEVSNVGTSSNDYYSERGSTTSVYMLNDEGDIKEGKYALVGFIASGANGINGSITITAYVDAEKIAITDTYEPIHPDYVINPNMDSGIIADCVSRLTYKGWDWSTGETAEDFCVGTGTNYGTTFQHALDESWFDNSDITYFLEHNVLKPYTTTNKTTSEWVNGRTVFTTNEWNSMSGISFKIKVEANEGLWVEEESQDASCFTTEDYYGYNVNRTDENVTACVSFLTNLWGAEEEGNTVDTGETYQAFCAGTGTNWGTTFNDALTSNWFSSDIESLLAINMVKVATVAITDYDTSCGLDVVIPRKINGGDVVEIGTYDSWNAFNHKGITSVKIPDTVTTLQAGAFSDNNLTSIVIPNSVTSMSDGVFSNNKIASVTFSSGLTTIEMNDFIDNRLTELTIPEGIETIHRYAFRQNNLTTVHIPSTVTYIGDEAFGLNSSLTTMYFNKTCTQINNIDGGKGWVTNAQLANLTIYDKDNQVCTLS